MSVEYTIACDGCGTVGGGSRTSAKAARAELAADAGWRVNAPGGRDFCKDCRPESRKSA